MNTVVRAHPRAASILVSVGAATALIGSFLPWLQTGSRSRTSYALFQVVDRLGFVPGGAAAWLFRLWPLVPFTMALTITLQWWHPTRLLRQLGAVTLPVLVAIAVGAVALTLTLAPNSALIRTGIGPLVTVVGGALMLAGAVGAMAARPRSRR